MTDVAGASAPLANEPERRRWNDARWMSTWLKREPFTAASTSALLSALRVQPGERILDVGSGGGGSAIIAAQLAAPHGSVIGVDLSVALCELARQRAAEAGVANVDFVVADAQTDSVPGSPFDAATSRFGVMFFEDPVAAFANVRRQLRAGGRFVFACWQSVEANPWHAGRVLEPFLEASPEPPPAAGRKPPGPFSLGDPGETADLLERAGFVEVSRSDHSATLAGPVSSIYEPSQLEDARIPPERRAEAHAAAEAHVARFAAGEGSYEFPLAFAVWVARSP